MFGQLTTGAEFSKGTLLLVCEIESFSGFAQMSTGWNLRNQYIFTTLKMLLSGFMVLNQVGRAADRVDAASVREATSHRCRQCSTTCTWTIREFLRRALMKLGLPELGLQAA